MKSLIAIVLSVFVSWYFIDLASDSLLRSIMAPILLFVSIVAFGFWLVIKAGIGREADGRYGGDTGGFGDGSGDGGGCGGE
ncbi:MAG: hypothetical protein N0C81_19025 [Candidatus Thiodiazotropha lotti]|uniref:Uncharacterized protein n=1 Tax=Candidatus Thiodiazotropha lotti TaxID=2792787 RepID=A0A9E4N0G4_9GAMM|nr:hypothetical protein [Candidatus Thiodiazotropha lotti]MCG7940562.1 hypothetical protein [Candidatus Thiodiazotropha lotti]MCG7986635.1 hypothetical protein [Candidatus Thiodiazotropha lotti]MCG8009721.1 hypothetical protein [Candidatus Thiodiazotropha lotti]MCG8012678.1 hypothetical protein [Candidatus Thiodiazotropha lotti]